MRWGRAAGRAAGFDVAAALGAAGFLSSSMSPRNMRTSPSLSEFMCLVMRTKPCFWHKAMRSLLLMPRSFESVWTRVPKPGLR